MGNGEESDPVTEGGSRPMRKKKTPDKFTFDTVHGYRAIKPFIEKLHKHFKPETGSFVVDTQHDAKGVDHYVNQVAKASNTLEV